MLVAELLSATQAAMGKTIWQAWRGVGSHIFFEMGTPITWTGDRIVPRVVGGIRLEARPAGLWGSHGIAIAMAEWQLFSDETLIAHSESSDAVFQQVLRWIKGQHLVAVDQKSRTTISLRFDLKARFELTCPPNTKDDSPLLTIRHGEQVTTLRADGNVVVEPWS